MQFIERKHYVCIKNALKSVKSYIVDEIEVKCRESKKEDTDLELEYPQTVAQSYKVLENNS